MRVLCISKILGAGLKLYDYGTSPEALPRRTQLLFLVVVYYFGADKSKCWRKEKTPDTIFFFPPLPFLAPPTGGRKKPKKKDGKGKVLTKKKS